MVMRRIPSQFLTFEQLRTPEVIRQLIVRPPRDAPRHRSHRVRQDHELASMINFINDNYDRPRDHAGRPDRVLHRHKKCTVNQREIGIDVPTSRRASAGRCE